MLGEEGGGGGHHHHHNNNLYHGPHPQHEEEAPLSRKVFSAARDGMAITLFALLAERTEEEQVRRLLMRLLTRFFRLLAPPLS